MLHAIRQCVHVAQQPHTKKQVGEIPSKDAEKGVQVEHDKTVDYRDFFYMATLGGAEGKEMYLCICQHNNC